jgi:hypothetical protein
MALAIRMEDLIRAGGIADYSELAKLGHVSRARITQIMNLLLLSPDIQEQILFLSPTNRSRDPMGLAHLQPITRALDWNQQRRLWAALKRSIAKLAMMTTPLLASRSSARAWESRVFLVAHGQQIQPDFPQKSWSALEGRSSC